MKTNSVLRTFAIAVFAVIFSNSLVAQFIGSTTNDQLPIVEERKGGTTTYSVPGPGADDYTWAITGSVVSITPAPDAGDGSVGNPYVINWTNGLTSIQVQWAADDNTITSVAGDVSVQQKVTSGTIVCPSMIQSWDVALWSAATADIATADFEICSGDAVGGSITVDFTGAPNFDFTYTVTDVEGVTGAPVVVNAIAGASTTIALPANLVNTSPTYADQTYVITLTQMNDGFTGDGTLLNDTFTITVHATVVTGPISSDRALTRR